MIKLLGLITLATVSLPAFSQTCYVDMVNRYNQVVRTFTAYDNNDSCKEGMKQCRLTIRQQPHLGGVDCIRDMGQTPNPNPYPNPNPNPYPNPNPNPNPNPYPNPYPQPDQNYPHHIMMGEEVYNVSNNRYAEVISQDRFGKFVLRYRDNGAIGSGWDRNDLAPLRGCDQDICVNERVYNTNNNRYARVVGLQMVGKFVLKYDDNGATGDGWSRDDMAVLEGCDYELCVGEQIYNVNNNRYAEIVGLQSNGLYVLKYQDNGATGDGWNRNDIAVMKGCQSGLCVGSRVINLSNRRYARVVALQAGERFVLRFDDNGATGDGWSVSDLAPIR